MGLLDINNIVLFLILCVIYSKGMFIFIIAQLIIFLPCRQIGFTQNFVLNLQFN